MQKRFPPEVTALENAINRRYRVQSTMAEMMSATLDQKTLQNARSQAPSEPVYNLIYKRPLITRSHDQHRLKKWPLIGALTF